MLNEFFFNRFEREKKNLNYVYYLLFSGSNLVMSWQFPSDTTWLKYLNSKQYKKEILTNFISKLLPLPSYKMITLLFKLCIVVQQSQAFSMSGVFIQKQDSYSHGNVISSIKAPSVFVCLHRCKMDVRIGYLQAQ